MRTGECAPAQARVACECLLLDQLADRTESSVLQTAHIELPARGRVFGPAQEEVARCLHHTLALDYSLALMALEFRSEPLDHGFAGFLDLQEQRRAVAA